MLSLHQAFPSLGGVRGGLNNMKRIKFILLAITMLLTTPVLLTSCQEDAPEINYTMNVSVINDFTKVVEAINNGSLKNEEAIKKLTEAIDKMNTDQQTKLQAIIDVLNSVNATLETKLAAIEAAMKAQTLTLESKLALLETAIKNQTLKQEEMAGKLITAINNLQGNMEAKIEAITDAINSLNTTLESKLALIEAAIKALPDYSSQLAAIKTAIDNLPDYGDKLAAIEAAIKGMPDYSNKFDAVVAALNAMKTEIESLGTAQADIATKIGEVITAINNLIAEVKNGNTGAADALAQIIAKLAELKGNIGGGSSGGSGGGGGETPGGAVPPSTTFDGITFENIKKMETQMSSLMHLTGPEMINEKKFLVYKTAEGHYGKMEVTDFGIDSNSWPYILINAVTYNDDGSILMQTLMRLNVRNWHGVDFETLKVEYDENTASYGNHIDFYYKYGADSEVDYHMGNKGAMGAIYPQK